MPGWANDCLLLVSTRAFCVLGPVILAFGQLVTLNSADIDQDGGSNHHLTQAQRTAHRYFVVVEWPFESTNSGFHGCAQPLLAQIIGAHALAAQSTVQVSLAETQGCFGTGLSARVVLAEATLGTRCFSPAGNEAP